MERLAQRDIEALLSYVREIYAFSDLEGFASRVVSTLPLLLPSESASYTEIDVRSRKIGAEVMDPPASDAASAASIFDRHSHEHPLIDHYRRTGEGQAAKISDFLTRSQWRNRALYNEYFKDIRGVEHLMAIEIGHRRSRPGSRSAEAGGTSPRGTGKCSTCCAPTSRRPTATPLR